MAGPRLKSIKWWEGRRDVCGTVWTDMWWKNLPLSAHAGNTPSHFLPLQQNEKQHLGKGFSTLTHEMFPRKHGQVRQRSHYSASGLTWHSLAACQWVLWELFSSDRANFSPIMGLFKEKGKEVGEMIIRLAKLTLNVHMMLWNSQNTNSQPFIGTTFSQYHNGQVRECISLRYWVTRTFTMGNWSHHL